jgi:hypothetical protein
MLDHHVLRLAIWSVSMALYAVSVLLYVRGFPRLAHTIQGVMLAVFGFECAFGMFVDRDRVAVLSLGVEVVLAYYWWTDKDNGQRRRLRKLWAKVKAYARRLVVVPA